MYEICIKSKDNKFQKVSFGLTKVFANDKQAQLKTIYYIMRDRNDPVEIRVLIFVDNRKTKQEFLNLFTAMRDYSIYRM